ncbi:MAG TPA: hypothetical protein VFE17_09995 [Candidatus Baltobacteraceae bacterium]|nr:hypothetical protein [Candidatus Baltobacteraceae bacterium]
MVMVPAAVLIAAVIFTPGVVAQQYVLTSAEQRAATVATISTPRTFSSASQAALAAALQDGHLMCQNGEVGVKIYVDVRDGVPEYSFGKLIPEQLDPETSEEEITYDSSVTDGHLAVVGVWHRHPVGAGVASLWGHGEMISGTRQTVWTSVGRDLYVQFWQTDHRTGVSEPTLVCSDCVH